MAELDKSNSQGDSDEQIGKWRTAIDGIDEKLVALINQRLELALEIGKIKARKGAQVLDSAREYRVLERVAELSQGPISKNALHQVYKQIMAASREIQKPHRVSYLGPEATFTHIAAMSYFGRTVSFIPQPGIRQIFNELEKGTCHYGVVPIENSIEGTVNNTVDLLFESDLKICAEKYQSISHDLLSGEGAIKEIQEIYSHPQAFAQCRQWLQKYLPNAVLTECSSTAYAAQQALENPGTAAIASSEAAQMYNLEVVASRIEDVARNTTRFLIIGRDPIRKTGNDKTSVIFVTSHIPGALYKVLEPIAESGLNMVKLESRPTKHENWSYFFLADLEGHMEDPEMEETVAKMRELCLFLKCAGSYPRDLSAGGN